MGRKAFINDLRDAALPGRFVQVSSVANGDDDGTLKFVFQATDLPMEEIAVDAMISDVSDYPSDHTYFLFTTSENVPTVVTTAIESVQSSVAGHSISQMLVEVSAAINHALSGNQLDLDEESGGYSDAVDEDDPPTDDESDADMWSTNSPSVENQTKAPTHDFSIRATPSSATMARIRSDLRLAKQAGFKIGVLGNLELGGILCISVRISKLGISEEAMNAWGLKRNHYLILLIRYSNGYKNLEEVKEESASAVSRTEFRVALCEQYKPSIAEAINAFNQLLISSKTSNAIGNNQAAPTNKKPSGVVEPLFIGRPLNDLLTRLPSIIKYRVACSFSWTGAELFFNEIQAKAASSIDPTQQAFHVNDHPASQALPKVVTADHVGDMSLPRSMSLPLAAMQFVLRHFVRCTEFCLVCHCKIDTSFEALKPYVCSKPLCLFQYMTLGFGPSIEWEILAQPYVVDLLISFCYASAQGRRLKDFPIGIDLKVPVLSQSFQPTDFYQPEIITPNLAIPTNAPNIPSASDMPQPICTKFDSKSRELLFASGDPPGNLKSGDWVVVTIKDIDGVYHARVEENFFPTIRLGELIYLSSMDQRATILGEAAKTASLNGLVDAQIYVYDQSFDELTDDEKRSCIISILSTLPDVMEMKAFLESNPQDPSLKRYRNRISPTALNLLRWIIASNRSCIMQVDRSSSSTSFAGAEDRVSGMGDWMQFRFAQGAPDKEQRFMDCVKEVSTRLALEKFPTLFAWHGSPLANWHSIVREGLHFNDTLHGRAFGHGVYMSPQALTSITYSGRGHYIPDNKRNYISTNWRNSTLCVSSALALNEVVNAPDEFVHKSPHYVVNQVDWIQTRYLFVKGNHQQLGHDFGNSTPPKHVYQQDPSRTAVDEMNQPITIPITAVSKSRRPVVVTSPQPRGTKKAKVTGSTTQEQAEKTEDDAASMLTDSSDIEFLLSEDDDDGDAMTKDSGCFKKENLPTKPKPDETPQTDFIPGQLVGSTLPLLAPPANASISATKTLLTALKQLLAAQDSTPLHELGWYLDSSLITNMYQWPVELHSFPTSLPLASDMLAVGLKSIVLELRFSNTFPMSPPFVRVIRPRFLPFMSGGGGHVTAGGALCMELLTNSGWSPVSSLESVLLQVRMAICSVEPKPARLMMGSAGGAINNSSARNAKTGGGSSVYGGGAAAGAGGGEYNVGEAIAAYKRACAIHGWEVPKEFDEFLTGQPTGAQGVQGLGFGSGGMM